MALNDSVGIPKWQRSTIHIPAKQNDRGYLIILTITDCGQNIVDPSDTATFREAKPDGTFYYGDCVVNSDGTVSLPIDDAGQMLAVAGYALFDVTIKNNAGVTKSTQNFVLDIQAAPGGESIPSSNVWIELEQLIERVDAYENDAEAYAAGTRDGVPVEPGDPAYNNNAPYYLQQTTEQAASARQSAANAEDAAERAEQAANTAGYLDVEIVDGHLIYTRTDAVDVDFVLENGYLIMEAI